jgi:hypothetical protein
MHGAFRGRDAWWCVRVGGRREARHIPAMLVGARQLCI